MRFLILLLLVIAVVFTMSGSMVAAQGPADVVVRGVDSDGDGLADDLEQALLEKFSPQFRIGERECSNLPAQFRVGKLSPIVEEEDGTIYGQVFPAKSSTVEQPMVEIHYYHLWWKDCGPHGHPLDAEHVSTLVTASGSDLVAAKWTSRYWYAAAHEDTVCDVSQIARSSTLDAEEHGPKVWISPGKHASYLNETLCERGCGADRCSEMKKLAVGRIINLGEPGVPMNGTLFAGSKLWPLASKMRTTNFPAEPIARLEGLPETDIAWFHAGRHPAQQIISISGSTEGTIAEGGRNTTAAISTAGASTSDAISTAQDSTGNALQKSYRKTKHALGSSARHVGDALHVTPKGDGSE